MPAASIPGTQGPPLGPSTTTSSALVGGGTTVASTPISTPKGFCIAFNDAWNVQNPAWTWLDDPAGPYIVQGWGMDAGRSYEFDRTGTSTATVRIFDRAGAFDPTNATSALAGNLEPLKQAALAVYNPVSGTWSTIWRGFVSEWHYVMHPTENYIGIEVSLVDGQDIIAACEMVPGGTFGSGVAPDGTEGDIYFAEDLTLTAVQTRINTVLNQVGWPAGLRSIFTGNVKLQSVSYPLRSSALQPIYDATDAEFPSVSQFYISKGVATFRGRFARFNPTNVTYGITTWTLGDLAAVTASPTTVVSIVEPFAFFVDKEHIYTSGIATPQGINPKTMASMYVTDAAAVAKRGLRTWSAENLLTAGGASSTTAEVEVKKFATYYVSSYKDPLTRVGQLSVHAALSSGNRATVDWAFVCGVSLGDRIQLKTTHAGGGGFNNTYFFVEGLHYDVSPLNSSFADVKLTLDLSPAAHYPLGYTFP